MSDHVPDLLAGWAARDRLPTCGWDDLAVSPREGGPAAEWSVGWH